MPRLIATGSYGSLPGTGYGNVETNGTTGSSIYGLCTHGYGSGCRLDIDMKGPYNSAGALLFYGMLVGPHQLKGWVPVGLPLILIGIGK